MNYKDNTHHDINKEIENASAKYYYNSSTVLKYLRKVLNEINHGYMDCGLRTGFIMKRYIEKYKLNPERGPKLVLLCLLKDIGLFYQDDYIPKDNHALAAASSFLFLNYCSPLKDDAKPLFYYKAKYMPNIDNEDYQYGILMTLLNQVVMYDYQEYTLDEMEELLNKDKGKKYNPEHVKNVIKLLRKDEDILEKLNNKTSLYVYETQNYILQTKYTDEDLLGFINTTNFSFEFHNHETLAHTVTVAVIARELAKKSRLPSSMCEEIYLAGLVHDIGKIRVPKEVLCFPGRLEGEMLKEMQRHAVYTREILEGSFSYKIVDIASNHHEKLDGSGYPRALRAIDLSIGDKIIAVADIASALYCKRSYKAAFPPEKIMAILESDAKAGKLDMRIVEHFVDNYDEIMALAKEREEVVINMYSNMKNKYEALKKSNVLYHFFDKKDNGVDAIFKDDFTPSHVNDDYDDQAEEYTKEDFEIISSNIEADLNNKKNDEIDEILNNDNIDIQDEPIEENIVDENNDEESEDNESAYAEEPNEELESIEEIEDSNVEDESDSKSEEIEQESIDEPEESLEPEQNEESEEQESTEKSDEEVEESSEPEQNEEPEEQESTEESDDDVEDEDDEDDSDDEEDESDESEDEEEEILKKPRDSYSNKNIILPKGLRLEFGSDYDDDEDEEDEADDEDEEE